MAFANSILDPDVDGFTTTLENLIGTPTDTFTATNDFAQLLLDPDEDGFTSSFENNYSALDPDVVNTLADVAAPDSPPEIDLSQTTHINGWHYTEDLGWIWTSQGTYPFVYRKTEFDEKWIYHLPGSSSPRYFYDYSVNNWFEID